jgi:hypothetical protein
VLGHQADGPEDEADRIDVNPSTTTDFSRFCLMRSPDVQSGHGAADHHPLDFRGALEDGEVVGSGPPLPALVFVITCLTSWWSDG